MKEPVPTIVYIVVCDEGDEVKFVCSDDSFNPILTRKQATDLRNERQKEFPEYHFYIKDIIL